MKKIEWVKWRDPLKPSNKEENFDMQSFKDSYKSNDFVEDEEENHHVRVISGPYGMIPLAEHGLMASQYKMWVMHTNFDITTSAMMSIETISGIEILRVWTRYRAWVGFGNLFDVDLVKKNIENVLSANKIINRIGKKVENNTIVEGLSNNLSKKHKFWVIYKKKAGKIEFICGEDKSELLCKMEQEEIMGDKILAFSWDEK